MVTPELTDEAVVAELTDAERVALPPADHQPVWMGLTRPSAWICRVCWSEDGSMRAWPCEVARAHGAEVARAGGLDYHA